MDLNYSLKNRVVEETKNIEDEEQVINYSINRRQGRKILINQADNDIV